MIKSLFKKVVDGFKKTREVVTEQVQQVLRVGKKIDPELYDDLEVVLLRGDVGPATTAHLLDRLKERVKKDGLEEAHQLRAVLREEAERVLREGVGALPTEPRAGEPKVVLVIGVNGVGKTTSLAKLARRAQGEGRVPLIVASDTFRAAASEQLQVWAERLDVQLVRSQSGADPSSVAFDGVQAGVSRGVGLVLVDTAGRLQTKGNLMEELKKIHRVTGKALPGAPHETILVLDATIGQNAISQARLFSEAVPITGLLLAKLDGTSKGGVVLTIAHELKIPVRYAGVGEGADDLVDFDPGAFAAALVGDETAVDLESAAAD